MAHGSRIRYGLPVVFLLALACCTWLLVRGGVAGAAGCSAKARVIAVRGSGDTDQGGPGTTLRPFLNQLEALADPGVVDGEGLRYEAVSVFSWKAYRYRRSVDEGVKNLVRLAKQRVHECGGRKLVLAGYSQGAQVVHEALGQLTPIASHVGAVVLFGDPHFDPHSRAAQPGTYSDKQHGILGLPDHDFPAAFPHVASYCRHGDWVCQGRPDPWSAHSHYAPKNTEQGARKVAEWLGLRRTRECAPAHDVAAILDDSGSMEENDPLNIRAAAMQLLITEPGGEDRTLGAVEFGTEAGPLFSPGLISSSKGGMLASLGNLADDGYGGTGVLTDYNAAFSASAAEQPGADARIFLTDGGHDVGDYENGHAGGPRTYVIGLNIGPSGHGDEAADLLGRIAGETGGRYYPLRRHDGDDPSVQVQRLQPVFNSINAQLECQIAPSQAVRSLKKVGAPAKPVKGSFLGNVGEQIVVSWTTPGTVVTVTGISVRNPSGGVVANLSGKGPKKGGKRRKVEQVQTSTVVGGTFQTVTVTRPKHGSTISVRVAAEQLTEPTLVTVQMSPVDSLPTAVPENTSVPPLPASTPTPPSSTPTPAPPPPPQTWWEQETPNHPVNTFTNYHNASGMGPPIAAGQWVEVSCRVYDPTIASVNPDGYWYRIASAPWSNAYYAPANTFMNGDPYGGPYTHNTDFAVALC